MLKIGEFSRLSRVSIRALRRYDEAGLLTPVSTDPFTGYRYYSERQLPIANRIRALRDMGFPLAAVREVLGCYDDPGALERCLLLQQAEAREVLEEAERRLRLLDTALERLRKDKEIMKYDVTIKTLPERQVASVRQIIPSYDREGDLWSIYCQETARMKIQDGDPALCTAVYHDGSGGAGGLRHVPGELRSVQRGERSCGRLGGGQRLGPGGQRVFHLPRQPPRHPEPRRIRHRGLLSGETEVTASACLSFRRRRAAAA